jgi:WD40 repeat protein
MTGSYDKKVKVWDIRHAKRSIATISGQQAAVFCLQFDDEVLITGSADYMMRVFDIC